MLQSDNGKSVVLLQNAAIWSLSDPSCKATILLFTYKLIPSIFLTTLIFPEVLQVILIPLIF